MRKGLIAVMCSALFSHTVAVANVNSDMNNFFNKLGFEGNATDARAWQGQAAGYATGGNLFIRNQVKQLQIASFTPPSLNAGCGGIDAYLGSFSHINGEQLQQFVKQLMQNSTGYFFDLALQTTVPELKSAKDFLQQLASDVNSMNISSCQAAQGIVGGLWPTNTVQSQKICQDIAGQTNMFSDWAASRQGCTVGGQMNNAFNRAPDNMKDQVIQNKNLMWEVLNSNKMLDGDNELKELIMNLTGTLIFGKDNQVTTTIPKVNRQELIKALMYGGTINIEGCVSVNGCLELKKKTVTVTKANGLNSLVSKTISQIQSKLKDDTALTPAEKGFIQSTSIPILRYLVDPMQLNLNVSILPALSDYIAYDILLQYLLELIDQAKIAMANRNFPEEPMKLLRENVSEASRQLEDLQRQVDVKANVLMEMERQMSYLRQQTSSQLQERYQRNYHFNMFTPEQKTQQGG
ncbi:MULTISPECIES: conjugal transfer pilus assembly protein TraH [Enterobacterales]|uniref:Conjugal transfer pilus assembly protein TraH n=3 Tax=Providencia TaxID=586 RepID=A0A9N8D418_PRORE|nr:MULTISPECIES: conjugal transfer pilus assembly protein TraH [Providencia]MCJ4607364.1 F-type conjugal transfer protein TraH [Klebsiella pneumoniae]ELR5099809.1 F-type conjugal transfer protein TraH [Providencia rettgeri]ELT5688259.1 F-type conjugal transfer protein TraH [Providencia rettgeri]EMC8781234.1 F-type conjugal transfer protein TraH [Providencia rettgeri]MCL0013153.1 F-type conjugal transfer protein TraH [Providencia rettgeri]